MGIISRFNPLGVEVNHFAQEQSILNINGGVTNWQEIELYRGLYNLVMVGAGGGAGGWGYVSKYPWGGGCGGSGAAIVCDFFVPVSTVFKFMCGNGGTSSGDFGGRGQPGGYAALSTLDETQQIIAGGGTVVTAWDTNGVGGVITNNNFDFITNISFQSSGNNGSGAGGLWASGSGGASVYNGYGVGGGHTFSGGNAFFLLTYLQLRR